MRKQARIQAGTYNPPEDKKTVHLAADMKKSESTYGSDSGEDNLMLVSVNPNTVLLTNTEENSDTWILDSGATDHCSSMKTDFNPETYKEITPFQLSGICCNAIGKGNITAKMKTMSGSIKTVTIQDVLYVPELQQKSNVPRCRLLSLSKLQDNSSASLHFTSSGSCIQLKGNFQFPLLNQVTRTCTMFSPTLLNMDMQRMQ